MSPPRWINGGYTPETEKAWERLIGYCVGKGVDLGCGATVICDSAIPIDHVNNIHDPTGLLPSRGINVVIWDLNQGLPHWCRDMDYVYSSHCLEHLLDWEKRLKEWWGAVKNGGKMILYLPNPELPHVKDHGIKKQDFRRCVDGLEPTPKVVIWEDDIEDDGISGGRYSYIYIAEKNG